MLLDSAPFIRLNVIGALICKSLPTLIMKTSPLSPLASKVKKAFATELTLVDEKLYTVLPKNVMGPVRPLFVCVGGVDMSLKARPYAVTKSVYACPTVVPGACGAVYTVRPTAVPGGKPVIVIVAPTLPVTTEVPVFEIVPPSSPKEKALARFGASTPPKTGIASTKTCSVQTNQIRTFSPTLRTHCAAATRIVPDLVYTCKPFLTLCDTGRLVLIGSKSSSEKHILGCAGCGELCETRSVAWGRPTTRPGASYTDRDAHDCRFTTRRWLCRRRAPVFR